MKWFKRITHACLSGALLFTLTGCGGSSAPAETAAPEPADTVVEDSAEGTYSILGMYMEDAIVMSDSLKGNYIELAADGTGKLYFGDDNQGPISSWSLENGAFTMKAGVSDFTGTMKDGILDLDLSDNMVLAFAKEGTDTSKLNIMTLEEYQNAKSSDAPEGAVDAGMAGDYTVYAVESEGVCVRIPEEDKSALGFVLNEDGTGSVRTGDESENLLWSAEGEKLILKEMDGTPIGMYEITVKDGIMKLVVPANESSAEVIEYLVTPDADVSSIKITG